MAHLRRDFHDEWDKTKSAIAREALDCISTLYDIEREITGRPADIRLATRQKHSALKVAAFFAWAERALRPIGIGRKNWLFAGADTGAETLARAMTIIETAKLNGRDPQAYLADILARINDHKINRLDDLLPWNWSPLPATLPEAA